MNAKMALLALSMLVTGGCWSSCELFGRAEPVDSTEAIPPQVESVVVPAWPPFGPQGVFRATVSDDCCLSAVELTFAHHVRVPVSGTFAQVDVPVTELGEGIGSLWVDVIDADGEWDTWEVDQLLIDLSPPVAEIGNTVVRAEDGQIEIWAGDAWVLGGVELSFNGVTQTRTFPAAYPATLGEEWDHSLEIFPAFDFPAGVGIATLTVTDAAGNSMVDTFELVIDGSDPEVSIASPAAGSTVSGFVEVAVDAADAEGPTTIELRAGGALIATAAGPHATITIDTSSFLPGPIELEAVAIDAAGHESAKAVAAIVIADPTAP